MRIGLSYRNQAQDLKLHQGGGTHSPFPGSNQEPRQSREEPTEGRVSVALGITAWPHESTQYNTV